mmetsp:Transcript_14461/g.49746  ORF Transcript_14461/g.49746 Transcript_14461/m.49746 type:complete len:982 (-) Transcript_14461:286-3231(-)
MQAITKVASAAASATGGGGIQTMRGLEVFIHDIRNSSNKDAETSRIEKELANIRKRFKGDSALSMYDRKKYVWKLLFIYMLGYDVDFGHMEVLGLISSQKHSEKQVGYIVTSVLLNETHEFLRLVINSIRTDLISGVEPHQCLALACVANVGGVEMAEALTADVQKLLTDPEARPAVRKKAALCLLRLFRKNPECVLHSTWVQAMVKLLQEKDLGLLTSVMSLLHGLVASSPTDYLPCFSRVLAVLSRLVRQDDVPVDYTYCTIPSPFLQVKCMRVLQYFPVPDDRAELKRLSDVTRHVLMNTEMVKNLNQNNAAHAVLFEALALVMYFDVERELMPQCVTLLGKFVNAREPNIRYLGLENMARHALVPELMERTKAHQEQILISLKDPDISIRRRALDLLYGMCDTTNAQKIVQELLSFLTTADFAIREELALRIAILAERFATSKQWYIDVIVALIEKAGEFVSDDVWHRVVQIVTNNPDLQQYAAEQMNGKLREGNLSELMVKLAGYILGEFGHTLTSVPAQSYFVPLREKIAHSAPATKALLLTSIVKMAAHSQDAQLRAEVAATLQRYQSFVDSELQQRSVEYAALAQRTTFSAAALAPMPTYPVRNSALEKRVESSEESTAVSRVRAMTADKAPQTSTSAAALTDAIGSADMLGNGSTGPVPAPAPAAGAAPPAASSADLLSELLEPAAPAAPAATAAPAVDPFGASGSLDALMGPAVEDGAAKPVHDTSMLFAKLATSANGVLYEDQYLQIGVKSQYRGAQGRLGIFFGNKHPAPLTNIKCSVPPTPGVQVQSSSVPSRLEPRQQHQVDVSVACQEPFVAPPSLNVSYTISDNGRVVNLPLHLPVMLCKFLTPLPTLASNDFFSRWQTLAAPPQKVTEQVALAGSLATGGKAAVESAISALQLGVVPNLDPSPTNIVAASSLVLQGGQPVACMLRLEADSQTPSQVRVTVATPHPSATAAIRDTLVTTLKGGVI